MRGWIPLVVGAAIWWLSGAPSASYPIVFKDVTREAGLAQPLSGMMGHCGAWGDLNADGVLDLYVGGFGDRPASEYRPAPGPVPNQLLLQKGGRFLAQPGGPASLLARSSSALWVDLDNDGFQELYVSNNTKLKKKPRSQSDQKVAGEPSRLFQNRRGKLVDVSLESGACPADLALARNVGVLDIDSDARLDLLVLEDVFSPKSRSRFFRNLGGLRFREAAGEAGLPGDLRGLGLAVGDVNGDDRADIFVAGDNRMFLSNGKGRYTEPAALREQFRWKGSDKEDWPSGAAFGDLNRDGLLDLVLGIHHEPARNRIFLHQGTSGGIPRFRDVTQLSGAPLQVPTKAPHVEIQDFDNDGWPDIYYSCAWLQNGQVTPCILRNLGLKDGVPRFSLPQPIDATMVYYLGPTGDYDRDGRVDLMLVNWFPGRQSYLLRNQSPASNRWLQVEARGRRAVNRMGIGSKVSLRAVGSGKLLGYQEVTIGQGYSSGQEAVCHFGLGSQAEVDVSVRFPNGRVVEKKKVKAGQRLVVEEP